MSTDVCVSNKRRHELKAKVNDRVHGNSSSSGDSLDISDKNDKITQLCNDDSIDAIRLSEGELSVSSEQ